MFGTRTTGNDAASFMIYGPNWKGETPKDIKKAFYMETTLGTAAFRTQLFTPSFLQRAAANMLRIAPVVKCAKSHPTERKRKWREAHEPLPPF